ncbi:hypothetical protein Sjap_016890 [Stephania japonica]|uniref:Mediator of RNA polymerase II transcription subunit 32 n=1 Tax=Stephania japonica TaxID=461633 RepID=A0AAP0I543_9MAGN
MLGGLCPSDAVLVLRHYPERAIVFFSNAMVLPLAAFFISRSAARARALYSVIISEDLSEYATSGLGSSSLLSIDSGLARVVHISMDQTVDALNNAYQEFVVAAAAVLETKEGSTGQKTAATDAALENFKLRWELFKVACDQAEEFVESVKQRIGSECLVDEATGSVAGRLGQTATTGLSPISAVRLEQMSKAVRWLVIELQQGSGATGSASHAHPSVPFDARFPEDSGQ